MSLSPQPISTDHDPILSKFRRIFRKKCNFPTMCRNKSLEKYLKNIFRDAIIRPFLFPIKAYETPLEKSFIKS